MDLVEEEAAWHLWWGREEEEDEGLKEATGHDGDDDGLGLERETEVLRRSAGIGMASSA